MPQSSQDWTDGFLKVGNQPVLDLLNTRLVVDGQIQEMLIDTSALVRWLLISGVACLSSTRSKLKDWNQADAALFLRQLLTFREQLRHAVFRLESGRTPGTAFIEELNARLAAHPRRSAILKKKGRIESMQAEGGTIADTLWAALLFETVSLLTAIDSRRLRQCESCVVHFMDTSKKNARRWCSMRLCGNRIKVAAYQERQRGTERTILGAEG